MLIVIAVLLGVLPQLVNAQANGLRSLQTGVQADAWDGVGRLNIDGKGFCTGALVAPDLVLTAAHCLYDKPTGSRIDPARIEFLAGWRNGRASAYRDVRRAVVLPDYVFGAQMSSERVKRDIALLELARPIKNTTVLPFTTAPRPKRGDTVGVVSYARDRSEAPSLQDVCDVLSTQNGMLVTSCSVDFGSSGAPIFTFSDGLAQIVSVVSAKAEIEGTLVSLGTDLDAPLQGLHAELAKGNGFFQDPSPTTKRIVVGQDRRDTGAKFVRP
ncbi:MAG: trypsin-like serine protease [Roseobacter sp.]